MDAPPVDVDNVLPQWHLALSVVFGAARDAMLEHWDVVRAEEALDSDSDSEDNNESDDDNDNGEAYVRRVSNTVTLFLVRLERTLNDPACTPPSRELHAALQDFVEDGAPPTCMSRAASENRMPHQMLRMCVQGVPIVISTLGDYVSLWAAANGYGAYFQAEWWKPVDVPLAVVFIIVQTAMLWIAESEPLGGEALPSSVSDFVLEQSKRINDTPADVRPFAADGRHRPFEPDYIGNPLLQPYGRDANQTLKRAVQNLASIIRTRNYRCLHPMVQAAVHLDRETQLQLVPELAPHYEQRPDDATTAPRITAGGAAFDGLTRAPLADEAGALRRMLHGSALMQLITGMPDFDARQMLAAQDPVALVEGFREFGRVLESVSVIVAPAVAAHWRTNMRNTFEWASSQTTDEAMRGVTTMFVKFARMVETLPLRDAYVVFARSCFARLLANGLHAVGPECRLLALLHYTLYVGADQHYSEQLESVRQLLPAADDALKLLTAQLRFRDITYDNMATLGFIDSGDLEDSRRVSELDRAARPAVTLYVAGTERPLAEYVLRGAQLLFRKNRARTYDAHRVSALWENEVACVAASVPSFVHAIAARPHAPIETMHATQHLDYALCAFNGAAVWSADAGLSRAMVDTSPDFDAAVRKVEASRATATRSARLWSCSVVNDAAYVQALSRDIAVVFAVSNTRRDSSPSADAQHANSYAHGLRRAFAHCARLRWSILDVARLALLDSAHHNNEYRRATSRGGEPWLVDRDDRKPLAAQYAVLARSILCERMDSLAHTVDTLCDTMCSRRSDSGSVAAACFVAICALYGAVAAVLHLWNMHPAPAASDDMATASARRAAKVAEASHDLHAVCTRAFTALARSRTCEALRTHARNLRLVVDTTQFAHQCRATQFCAIVFPGLTNDRSDHVADAGTTVLALSQQAETLLGLLVATSRVTWLVRAPQFVAPFMDSTLVPLMIRAQHSIRSGADKFIATDALYSEAEHRRGAPGALARADWHGVPADAGGTWRAAMDDSETPDALFMPQPALAVPGLWPSHERDRAALPTVLPDTLVIPYVQRWTARHLLDGRRYSIAAWKKYAPALGDMHFLSAPRLVPRDDTDPIKRARRMNHFYAGVDHETAARHTYCLDDEMRYGAPESPIRQFYSEPPPRAEPRDESLAREIAEITPLNNLSRRMDFTPLMSSTAKAPVDPLLAILNKTVASGATQTYAIFNALLRETLPKHCRAATQTPGDGAALGLDAIDVAFYAKYGLVLAVPDSVMSYLMQFIITDDQRGFFIREHVMQVCPDVYYNPDGTHISRYIDSATDMWVDSQRRRTSEPGRMHYPQKRLVTLNDNLISMQQLVQLGVVANIPKNRFKLAENAGVIGTTRFVPSALAHFSRHALSVDVNCSPFCAPLI
jgi:hypothetical protein